MANTDLTAQRLRELVTYDPDSGLFTRIVCADRSAIGPICGKPHRGYLYIRMIGQAKFFAHRLAWLYMTGEWPACNIDHIDGNGMNNRWANLREALRNINAQNKRKAHVTNLSGLLGVYPRRYRGEPTGVFRAEISVGDRRIYLGSFKSAEEGHAAYVEAKRRLHEGCTL